MLDNVYRSRYILNFIVATICILLGQSLADFYILGYSTMTQIVMTSISLLLIVLGLVFLTNSILNRMFYESLKDDSPFSYKMSDIADGVKRSIDFFAHKTEVSKGKVLKRFRASGDLVGDLSSLIEGNVTAYEISSPPSSDNSHYYMITAAEGSRVLLHFHDGIDQVTIVLEGEIDIELTTPDGEVTKDTYKRDGVIMIPSKTKHVFEHTKRSVYLNIYRKKC